MKSAIATKLINKTSTKKRKNGILAKVKRIMSKYDISIRMLNADYNTVYLKFPIPHSSFYHKMNNGTFTDVELDNIEFIIEQAEIQYLNGIEKLNK